MDIERSTVPPQAEEQAAPPALAGGVLPRGLLPVVLRRHRIEPLWALILPPMALAIGLTFAGIAARYRELAGASPDSALLGEVGFILVVEVGLACFFFGVALFVFRKLPREPVGLFLALTLVLLGAVETSMTDALINPQWSATATFWRWPVLSLRALEMICALTMLYIFPDGRFTPRWTRPLALIWGLANVAWLLFPSLPFNTIYGPTWRATPLASLLVDVGWFSSGIIALVLRYLRSADAIQRRQTWWVAAGMIAAVIGGLLYYGLSAFTTSGLIPMYRFYLASRSLFQVIGMGLLPVCLAIAILRYRLFDIDIIIRRTLVYTTLTVALGAIYLAGVTLLQALLIQITGQASALAVAGSTLTIAGLFQPLRARIQATIDRRFFRKKYDAAQVLVAFAQRAQQAADLDTLSADMLGVVQETLEPERVRFWIIRRP